MADDSPARRREAAAAAPPVGRAEWATLGLIVVVLVLSLFQFLAYDQTSNAGALWIADRVDLSSPFGPIPMPWFLSEDALVLDRDRAVPDRAVGAGRAAMAASRTIPASWPWARW